MADHKKDAVRVVGMCNGCDKTIMINQDTRLCEKCTAPEPPKNGLEPWGWAPSPKGKT